jgi:hypothetical protein
MVTVPDNTPAPYPIWTGLSGGGLRTVRSDGSVLAYDPHGEKWTHIGHTAAGSVRFDIDTGPAWHGLPAIGRQLTTLSVTGPAAELQDEILHLFGIEPWMIGIGPMPWRLSAMHRSYHRRSKARQRRNRGH